MSINEAEFVISDASQVPANDAGWQKETLPYRSYKPVDHDLVTYWYRSAFSITDTRQFLWAYFPILRTGGTILLNGVHIGEIPDSDATYQRRWFRPRMVFLPPDLLHEGRNEIAVQFSVRDPLVSFNKFYIGPSQSLRSFYEQMWFLESSSTQIVSALCLISGAMILLVWLRRRHERIYGMFGICVVFWGARTVIFRMQEVPMDYWLIWRFFYYFTTSGFIVYITIFLWKFSSYIRRTLIRTLIAYWLAGCVAFLLAGSALRHFMDVYWTIGFLPFTAFALIRLVRFAICERSPSSIAMSVATLIAIGLALHDYAASLGLFHLTDFYLLHLGISAFLFVMGWVLLDRFIDSLNQTESANARLALRIAEREKELSTSYERLKNLEREQAVNEERQRIIQEMHDGVGSQLLTTLVMVERGDVTQNDIASLLHECLNDMRLVIDALSPSDSDLLPVLGDLRLRMEPRFASLGLTLHWRHHNLPDTFEVAPYAGLQILRILQESFTNILKHAQAKNVVVDLAFTSTSINIQVTDDGIGICEDRKNGHGIINMDRRAKKIGSSLEVGRAHTGTVIRFSAPIAAIAKPAVA